MSIKEILTEYNEKLQLKLLEEQELKNKLLFKQKMADNLLEQTLMPSFKILKEEFAQHGFGRVAQIKKGDYEIDLIIEFEEKDEFTYKVVLEQLEHSLQANLYIHHIGFNNIIIHGIKEKFLNGIALEQITPNLILEDFYTRYKKFLLGRV